MSKDHLKELFNDVTDITPDKLQAFVDATMRELLDLKEELESEDPEVRERAMLSADEIRKALESQFGQVAGWVGDNPAPLENGAGDFVESAEQELQRL